MFNMFCWMSTDFQHAWVAVLNGKMAFLVIESSVVVYYNETESTTAMQWSFGT